MAKEITIKDVEAGQSIVALPGENEPKVTGFGGWVTRDRPKDKPVTNFVSSPAVRMAVDLLFDGWDSGTSVREDVNKLQSWGWARKDTKSKRPTRLEVTGVVIPLGEGRRWVVEDLDFGDNIVTEDKRLLRQQVTVTFLEYEAPDLIKVKSAGASYKTVKGDTLRRIAQKILGNSNRWVEIKKLNPKLRDPSKRLKPGKILKMPLL